MNKFKLSMFESAHFHMVKNMIPLGILLTATTRGTSILDYSNNHLAAKAISFIWTKASATYAYNFATLSSFG